MKLRNSAMLRQVSPRNRERGATAVQLAVIIVPVLFGMIGFAVDLGILYSAKGEIKAGASAMALAAAGQLIGTDQSADAASAAAQQTLESSSNSGNKYYFQGLPLGQTSGRLSSTVSSPGYFATLADALASSGATEVSGSLARHVRVTITGETPLLFWSFLPLATDRKVAVMATAVAGFSAPLCTACGIEPFGVAALNASDPADFGFVAGVRYSLTYLCNGAPAPGLLAGASQRINYVLLNRLDTAAVVFPDESAQIFRAAAGGLPGNTNSAQACFRVNASETVWANVLINQCSANRVDPLATAALCGLAARFDSTTPATVCPGVTGIETLTGIYQPDTDTSDYDAYTDYTGAGRRILTIPILDTLSGTASMTVLGFRQFLLLPASGGTSLTASDPFGRFAAMYIGSVAPVKQGRFDGCSQTAGPGKVVLHQ